MDSPKQYRILKRKSENDTKKYDLEMSIINNIHDFLNAIEVKLCRDFNWKYKHFVYPGTDLAKHQHRSETRINSILHFENILDDCVRKIKSLEDHGLEDDNIHLLYKILQSVKLNYVVNNWKITEARAHLPSECRLAYNLGKKSKLTQTKIIKNLKAFMLALKEKISFDYSFTCNMTHLRSIKEEEQNAGAKIVLNFDKSVEKLHLTEDEKSDGSCSYNFLRETLQLIKLVYGTKAQYSVTISDIKSTIKVIERDVNNIIKRIKRFTGESRQDEEFIRIDNLLIHNMLKLVQIKEVDNEMIQTDKKGLMILINETIEDFQKKIENSKNVEIQLNHESQKSIADDNKVEDQHKTNEADSKNNDDDIQILKLYTPTFDKIIYKGCRKPVRQSALIKEDLLNLIRQVNLYAAGGNCQQYAKLRASFLDIIYKLDFMSENNDSVKTNLIHNAKFYLTVLDLKSNDRLKSRLFKPRQKVVTQDANNDESLLDRQQSTPKKKDLKDNLSYMTDMLPSLEIRIRNITEEERYFIRKSLEIMMVYVVNVKSTDLDIIQSKNVLLSNLRRQFKLISDPETDTDPEIVIRHKKLQYAVTHLKSIEKTVFKIGDHMMQESGISKKESLNMNENLIRCRAKIECLDVDYEEIQQCKENGMECINALLLLLRLKLYIPN